MLVFALCTALAGGNLVVLSRHLTETHGVLHEVSPSSRNPGADRVDLAARVSDALLSGAYLQVNARIVHQGKELLVRSDMTTDKLRVEAFRGSTLFAAFAIEGDRVQEYRPVLVPGHDDVEYRNVIVEFDKLALVEGAVSVGFTMLLDPDTACEFGTLMTSWLDPRIDLVSTWTDRILNGERLEDQMIDGVRCMVFHDSVIFPANEERGELTIKNTLYINSDTSLPVRWDTSQSTNRYSIERERYYEFVRASKPPENIVWRLDSKQLQSATPPRSASSVAARSGF